MMVSPLTVILLILESSGQGFGIRIYLQISNCTTDGAHTEGRDFRQVVILLPR